MYIKYDASYVGFKKQVFLQSSKIFCSFIYKKH